MSLDLDGPGWVLVCSDGLWNYCSEPQRPRRPGGDARAARRGADPLALAAALVDWANAQGGQDNITVALARIDPAWRRHRRTTQPTDQRHGSPRTREEVQPDGHVLS